MGLIKKIINKNKNKSKTKQTIKDAADNDIDMIVAIINRGYADFVVDAARDAGASGATIMYGRSSMKHDEMIKGINLQAEKEIILIVVKKELRKKVMQEICERTSLNEKGNGVCFSLPVNKVVGVKSFDKNTEKKL